MLTCPNCHHVLAAHSCCGLNVAVPPPTFPPASGASLSPAPGALGGRLGPTPLGMGLSPQPQQALATPHISGHMFHFPTTALPAGGGLSAGCHGACHVTCHSHCLGAGCRSPWQWPDSGGHHLPRQTVPPARMHTSGGGLIIAEGGAKAASAAAGGGGLGVGVNGFRDWTVWDDERALGATRRVLEESGWYWARLSWREAETLLQSTSLGTFLVRDSADARFLYSLSVQTERGPTSVRIHYAAGKFRLDCEAHMTPSIPEFASVVSLVEHYIRVNQKLQKHVWVDAHGKVYSPITIRQPLKRAVPSLKHLSRLAVNMAVPRSCSAMRLPPTLCQYVDEYPFWC